MLLHSETQPSKTRSMDRKLHSATTCVNCGQDSFAQIVDGYDFDTGKKQFVLERCNKCQLTRTSPVLNEAELAPYYDSGYYGTPNKKFNSLIEAWTIFSNNRLAKNIIRSTGMYKHRIDNKTRVLDIGCGRANLLKAFDRKGFECFGVERANFPDDPTLQNITIFNQDFLETNLQENSFDIVVIWHVLEHLSDPASTLKKVAKILKQDGKLVIAVPNFGSLQSKLFGKHWFHLDLPRHTYHFTNQSLQSMMNKAGLSITKLASHSFDQGVYGFIQSALNYLSQGKPNTLYSILKTSQRKPSIGIIAWQFFLAGLLAPVAILEYFVSMLLGSGACLTVEAIKMNKEKQ